MNLNFGLLSYSEIHGAVVICDKRLSVIIFNLCIFCILPLIIVLKRYQRNDFFLYVLLFLLMLYMHVLYFYIQVTDNVPTIKLLYMM